jgi:hypothetical protein
MRNRMFVHRWDVTKREGAAKKGIWLGLAIALVASLATAPPARAQGGGQSDLVLISGQPPFVFPESTNVSEFAPAFFPAPGLPSVAVLFYEDASQSVVSDQLWVQNQFFYFASDPNLVNLSTLGIPVIGALVENGTPQDVSSFFGLPTGSVQVLSDADIPEPGTMTLVGLGFVGLLAVCRRRS